MLKINNRFASQSPLPQRTETYSIKSNFVHNNLH